MGLFKSGFRFGRKKSSDSKQPTPDPDAASLKPSDTIAEDDETSEDEDDPLNLRPQSARPAHRPGEAPPKARPESAKGIIRTSSATERKGDVDTDHSHAAAGALSARTTARHPTEGWKDVHIATEAVNFMGSISSQVSFQGRSANFS
jgi:hypothetical protein